MCAFPEVPERLPLDELDEPLIRQAREGGAVGVTGTCRVHGDGRSRTAACAPAAGLALGIRVGSWHVTSSSDLSARILNPFGGLSTLQHRLPRRTVRALPPSTRPLLRPGESPDCDSPGVLANSPGLSMMAASRK